MNRQKRAGVLLIGNSLLLFCAASATANAGVVLLTDPGPEPEPTLAAVPEQPDEPPAAS